MTFQSVLAILLHLDIQPLAARILMLSHKVVVDFLIPIHCMDWLDHYQEVLEGTDSCSQFKRMPQSQLESTSFFHSVSYSMIRYASESSYYPERRQSLAFEVWQSVRKQLGTGDKITILTNGPLTNLANISISGQTASTVIEVCFNSERSYDLGWIQLRRLLFF
jgi:hypothetical protein